MDLRVVSYPLKGPLPVVNPNNSSAMSSLLRQGAKEPSHDNVSCINDTISMISQTRYSARSEFKAQSSISFTGKDGSPTSLQAMAKKDFRREDWNRAWTDLKKVSQKISLRVRIEMEEPAVTASVNRQMNARREHTGETYTKLQLGQGIARALQNSGELKEFYQKTGCEFGDLVIYELRHVRRASWQPVLGVVKVVKSPFVPI